MQGQLSGGSGDVRPSPSGADGDVVTGRIDFVQWGSCGEVVIGGA